MKPNLRILTLAAALCASLSLPAIAAESHDHDHKTSECKRAGYACICEH